MKKTCRVYLVTNTINGKQYVGWTFGTIERRWKNHCNSAGQAEAKGLPLLHKAIRKYGEAAFTRALLCETEDEESAREKEKFFIAQYRTFYKWKDGRGYNMTLGGEGATGYEHTAEGLERVSRSSRDRWGDEEWAAAWRKRHQENPPIAKGTKRPEFAEKMRGRKRPGMHSEETKQNFANLYAHTFLIILPDGERRVIRNLTKYCEDQGLNRGHMHACSRGELRSYKGHFVYSLRRLGLSADEVIGMHFDDLERLRRPVREDPQAVVRRQFLAVAPDGEEHVVTNLREFCEERRLPYRSMYRLALGGRRKLRSGWRCRYADGPVRVWEAKAREVGGRSPGFGALPESARVALTSRESLERMYVEQGLSVQAIADRFGVGRWLVRAQLERFGITVRGRGGR